VPADSAPAEPEPAALVPGEPEPGEPVPGEPAPRRRARRWRYVAAALLIVLAGVVFITARWFVWPSQQAMPPRVDAIVMLNGPGDRLDTALNLAWARRASMIVISRGSGNWGHGSVCAPKMPGVTVICFDPSPQTTRGEAEFAGRLAARYHWRSIAVVTVAPQDTVARLRVGRCFSGTIYIVNAPLAKRDLPYQVAYEWGSALKALVVQRSC
jgi:hypothetical protein